MTAEELEELLAPRGNTAIQQQPILPLAVNLPSTGSLFRGGTTIMASTSSYFTPGYYATQDLGVTINSFQDQYSSYARSEREFTEEEKDLIRQEILNYINSTAVGVRFDRQELQGLSRRVTAHIEAYMYRWFPYMRHPKIECIVNVSQYELAASFSIRINELPIATIGVRTR